MRGQQIRRALRAAGHGVVLRAGGLWLPGRGRGENDARPEDVVQGGLRQREVKGGTEVKPIASMKCE